MSEEEKNPSSSGLGTAAASVPTEQPYVDEHTTEPQSPSPPPEPPPPPSGKWQMPKPKFQKSSGYLPQGYLKTVQDSSDDEPTIPMPADRTQSQAERSPAVPEIEPQPDLAEQLIPDDLDLAPAAMAPAPAKRRSGLAIILVLGAILVFAAAFLTAVYFLFFAKPPDPQF